MKKLNWITRTAFAGLALIAGCSEPDCPSYLRTEGDDCVVPGEPDSGRDQGTGERQSPQQTATDGGVSRSNPSTAGEDSQKPQDGGTSVARGDAGSRTAAGGGGAASAAGAGGLSTTSDADASSPQTAMATCGNGKREGSELCDGADCPIECKSDNACIVAKMEGSAATCDARCTTAETTMCGAADGCCPMACDHGTDKDCSPSCGDGVLTGMETCEPGSAEHPCPSLADCGDRDVCTEDFVTGSAQQCSAKCANKPLTRQPIECDDGNPCTDDTVVESSTACVFECRSSSPMRRTGSCVDSNPCTDDTPVPSTTSCEYSCPHPEREPDAISCDDGNPCTTDMRTMSTTACEYTCEKSPVPNGQACGNGRMCMDGSCEAPPVRCGDGAQQGSEECDDGAETWECDRTCRRRNLYIACSTTSDCSTGQSCTDGACVSECGYVDGTLIGCPGGVLPAPALEIACYVVQNNRGHCRPSCTSDAQCPSRMRCIPATNGAYGTCFP